MWHSARILFSSSWPLLVVASLIIAFAMFTNRRLGEPEPLMLRSFSERELIENDSASVDDLSIESVKGYVAIPCVESETF